MDCEAHPVRPAQGQTAILEGKDHVPTTFIAPENMRSEAHPELHMGSAQTGAVVNGLLDDGRACSFPRQPVWLAAVLHLLTPEAPSSAVASHDHLRVDEQLRIATHVCVQLAGNLMHLIAIYREKTKRKPSWNSWGSEARTTCR
jgi:hypothetical protein